MFMDLYSEVKAVAGYAPPAAAVADNTAMATAIIDTANARTMFVIQTGTLADADATFAITMTEGDASDLSDGTTVAAADIKGATSFTFADDGAVKLAQYMGRKRYVKCTVTPSGNSGNAPLAIVALQAGRRVLPPN